MVASCVQLWFNERMKKAYAIELLGGTPRAAADAVGISYTAVARWPDPLPRRIADRVIAALVRDGKQVPKRAVKADREAATA